MKKRLLIGLVALFASGGIQADGVPYDEILSILQDNTVLTIADQIKARKTLEGLASALRGVQTFDTDIKAATAAGKNFKPRLTCVKVSKAIRTRNDFKIDGMTCEERGCKNKVACLKAAIKDLKILLKPLVNDLFVGYTDAKGNKQPALTIALFDIIQQPQFAESKEFQKTVDILRIILNVLDVIDNLIPNQA